MRDTVKDVILTSGKTVREVEHPTTKKLVLAHNGKDVYHFVTVTPDMVCTTGQPFMETFNQLTELETRVNELSSTVNNKEDFLAFKLELAKVEVIKEIPIVNEVTKG